MSIDLEDLRSNPSVPMAPDPRRSRRIAGRRSPRETVITALLLAVAAGPLSMLGPMAAGAALGVAFCYAIVRRPVRGAMALVVFTPLVVGIGRGGVIPLVRLNELLIVAVAGALLIRWVLDPGALRVRWRPIDRAVAAMAFVSLVPVLLVLVIKNGTFSFEEATFALTLTKHLVVYLIFRATVTNRLDLERCLWASLLTATFVAFVGLLQSFGVAGFDQLMVDAYARLGTTLDAIGRGQSTIGNSVAMAFYVPAHLAICLALLAKQAQPRWLLVVLALALTVGTIGTGQFSAVIALLIVGVGHGLLTGQIIRSLRWVVPGTLVLIGALWPVIEKRLAGFQEPAGVPQSWSVRWENLSEFVLPELADYNWALGVSPIAEIPAAHMASGFIWIESGHLFLLWIGGAPLLICYAWFNLSGLRATWGRRRIPSTQGAAAHAAHLVLWMLAILMLFDPHLTMRGSADILFPLLALALVAAPGDLGVSFHATERRQPKELTA